MSRPQILAVFVVLALLLTVATWIYAAMLPQPAAEQPDEPRYPQEILARLDRLEAARQTPVTPPPPPETPPKPADPPKPEIARTPIDGQDLAELLDLMIWKFRFRLPASDAYTGYVWLERWTRDGESPEYELLASSSGNWTESELVLKLPTGEDNHLFIRMGQLANHDPRDGAILPPLPISWGVLDTQPLTLGEPIHLITMAHSASGELRGGLKGVHRDHDETVYIKAGFTPGSYTPFDPELWVHQDTLPPQPPTEQPPPPQLPAEPEEPAE